MTAIELYRLRTGVVNGGASWGDSKIYESRDEFERALTLALLGETVYEKVNNRKLTTTFFLCRDWLHKVMKHDENGPQTTRIHSAEKLINGEWVDLHPRLVPPRLEYDD